MRDTSLKPSCDRCLKRYKLLNKATTSMWKQTLTQRIEKCCGFEEKQLEKVKKHIE